jgi:hypothetical protein
MNVRTLAGGAHPDGGLAPGQSAVDGSKYLRWMSGIQFFLREPLPINAGHQMLLDTPWGLTSISQRQFWEPKFTRELDDARVGALLSVEISSWDAPGLRTKQTAAACSTREEIAKETWSQLEAALPGQNLPRFADVMGWFLDDSVTDPNGPRANPGGDGKGIERVNLEPVVVNSAGAREIRPAARTRIENFFLAGDYVRTDTDLACMESANESGKRAANAVLDATGVRADECTIIKPQDPFWTAPLRWMDESRFERNLPWSGWDMGKWIVRGLEVAKRVTDSVFGETPSGAASGPMLAGPSAGDPIRGDLPDRNDWDPRLAELRESVSKLRGSEPGCPNLRDAEQALSSAELRARLERIRDRLAPPGALVTVNNRSDSLFARWRFFDSRHLHFFDPKRPQNDYREEGLEVPLPFQIYDADALVIQGSADIGYLEKQLAGTGLVPVRDQNGLGFIEVWIMDYPDACVGPHREAAIHVVVAPASTAPENLVYERRDGFGCELPILNAETKLFTLNILLSEMSAIAYGEQLFGIGKDYVDAKMDRTGAVRSFSFSERSREKDEIVGEPFFWGHINERGGLAQKVLSLAALTQAVGVIEVTRDTWKAIEMDVFTATMVGPMLPGFSKACNGFVEILADYKLNSMLTPVGPNDKIEWATHHKFGRHLDGMCFKPLLFTRDRHLKSVLYARDWIRHPNRLQAMAYATANDDVRPDWRAAADL